MPNPIEVLNTAEVAEIFGVDRATVVRWVASGRLPATKLPGLTGALIYQRRDVERLARKRAAA